MNWKDDFAATLQKWKADIGELPQYIMVETAHTFDVRELTHGTDIAYFVVPSGALRSPDTAICLYACIGLPNYQGVFAPDLPR